MAVMSSFYIICIGYMYKGLASLATQARSDNQ
jgi:hypothetical protein